MRVKQCGVGGEISRGAGIRLDVNTPLVGIETKCSEGAGSAQTLDLVDDMVAAVVAGAGEALGVLVGEDGAEGVQDGLGGEVLRGDELETAPLAVLLGLDETVELRVDGGEREVARRGGGGRGGLGERGEREAATGKEGREMAG